MFALVRPGYEFLQKPDPAEALRLIETAGRTCYKSEQRMGPETAPEFVRRIVARGHESVLEHSLVTVRFVVDRGVSHELVRHRLAAYSQESTRYCDYGGQRLSFVIPPWLDLSPGRYGLSGGATPEWQCTPAAAATAEAAGAGAPTPLTAIEPAARAWLAALAAATQAYEGLRALGWAPQQARAVLPHALKTDIVVSANFREWRHILRLRSAAAAHPQIREVMLPLLRAFAALYPALFSDLLPATAAPAAAPG